LSLFSSILKRTTVTPPEVIQAACHFYGVAPENVKTISAKQLKALSNDVWVVDLDGQDSAVVAYSPNEKESAIAAPWYN
jgi:hypothetical protein